VKGLKPRPQVPDRVRRPAAITVYDALRKRIVHGELTAGTLLNEVQTAADLEVSRTPVREALRELLNDGLLREGPRRQCVVAEVSEDLEREVRLMRVAMETLAVREAALAADTNGVDMLRLTMIRTDRAVAAGNINEALDCHDEFHLLIAQMGNLHLVADAINRLCGLSRLAGHSRGWSNNTLEAISSEHEAMIASLEDRDAEGAEVQMRAHFGMHTPG
jgi:DNA-binding GntR family transcriptional regulator